MSRDLAFGSAALAVAVGYYLLAGQIPESQLADAVGPQGLPRTYALMLGGLSLVLIASSVRGGSGTRESSPEPRAERSKPGATFSVLRPAGIVAMGAVYVLGVPWLGYILSLSALIAATTYYQGGEANRRTALVALSGAVLFWLLFVVLLGIEHPAGMWPELF